MHHSTWHLDVRRERADDVLVVSLAGRAGHASTDALREALHAGGAKGMVVDLSGLDYIAGAGLTALQLAAAEAEAGGCAFVLCGLAGAVRNAFELSGVLPGLRVETDRERAQARLRDGDLGATVRGD